MSRKTLILGGGILAVAVVVIVVAVLLTLRDLTSFPTSEEAGISFETIASTRPVDSTCLNEAGEAGLAKELVNLRERVVVVGAEPNLMPDDMWADYSPRFPWQKNINRNTLFDDHCFYRSPGVPVDCTGDECTIMRELDGYTWLELSAIEAQDCLPTPDAGCSADSVEPGAISITVTSKCHQIIFTNEIYELVDPAGNHYVMHATDTGTPDLNAAIPDGWTLTRIELDEPLEVLPFGGGDNCYHNVLRDNLGQGYHQIFFAETQYP